MRPSSTPSTLKHLGFRIQVFGTREPGEYSLLLQARSGCLLISYQSDFGPTPRRVRSDFLTPSTTSQISCDKCPCKLTAIDSRNFSTHIPGNDEPSPQRPAGERRAAIPHHATYGTAARLGFHPRRRVGTRVRLHSDRDHFAWRAQAPGCSSTRCFRRRIKHGIALRNGRAKVIRG
jgi:hypothetical protein